MCGIIGYIGRYRDPRDVLMHGLTRLEYRGDDSAGLAWRENGRIERVRSVGNLESLRAALASRARSPEPAVVGTGSDLSSSPDGPDAMKAGIGHTRWATHGGVTEANAHPHSDSSGRLWIVLNGIIENYLELRAGSMHEGIRFESDTDAEVVAHLISLYYDGDLTEAVRRSVDAISGHYALSRCARTNPAHSSACGTNVRWSSVWATESSSSPRRSQPSSPHQRVRLLRDGEIAVLSGDDVTCSIYDGLPHRPGFTDIDWDEDRIGKEGFETFMLKEIHEQPRAIADTLSSFHTAMEGDAARVDGDHGCTDSIHGSPGHQPLAI